MMSFKQTAFLAGGCILATLLFPPFHVTVSVIGATQNAGYGFILSPPVKGARIDIAVLLVQWLGIALISAFLVALPSLADLIGATKGALKANEGGRGSQERERAINTDYSPAVKQMVRLTIRCGVFALIAAGAAGCVLLVGRFILYELLKITPDDFSRPAMVFELIVISLLIIILFRKIVMQKSAATQIIGLGFYLSCLTVAILLVGLGQADLAPGFEWLGLIGMGIYFIIKPFKKSADLN